MTTRERLLLESDRPVLRVAEQLDEVCERVTRFVAAFLENPFIADHERVQQRSDDLMLPASGMNEASARR